MRALARPLLASWFVYGGVQSYLEPDAQAARIAPSVEPQLQEWGLEEVKSADLVKVHGIASVVCASALALSRTPRTAALGLAGLAGVSAAVSHPFWKETDEERKAAQLDLFLKDVSLVGGLLVASAMGHSPRHVARKKAKKEKAKAKANELKEARKAAKKLEKSTPKKRGK